MNAAGLTVHPRAEVEYESSGVPLEDYQLTRWDHRKQEQSEASSRRVEKRVKEGQAREQADPEITRRKHEAFRRAWELMQKFKTPEHEIIRWRVRLYCGHITDTRRHREVATPTTHGPYSMQCLEGGKGPSTIVAYEPIGLAAEPPRLLPKQLLHLHRRRSPPALNSSSA